MYKSTGRSKYNDKSYFINSKVWNQGCGQRKDSDSAEDIHQLNHVLDIVVCELLNITKSLKSLSTVNILYQTLTNLLFKMMSDRKK